MDPGFEHQVIRNELEALRVQFVRQRLAFRHSSPGRFGPFFKFPTYTARFDGLLMTVPGEAFDADNGDVAAKTTKPLQQGHAHPCPRCRQSRSQSAGARADN